jgi:hypothetical protein
MSHGPVVFGRGGVAVLRRHRVQEHVRRCCGRQLLRRRRCLSPARTSGFNTHRDSIVHGAAQELGSAPAPAPAPTPAPAEEPQPEPAPAEGQVRPLAAVIIVTLLRRRS